MRDSLVRETTRLVGAMLSAFPGRIATVSSFGAESAVLLHILAGIDRAVPVIFLDTGKLFPETLEYRDNLTARLGLADVRTVRPDGERLARVDPQGTLWRNDADLCCWNRKVEPLEGALHGFAAWVTGRKRAQGAERAGLDAVEAGPDGRIKVNPLAVWNGGDIAAYFVAHGLPRHRLLARGYPSIGCLPCTAPVRPDETPRSGRWHGSAKTECGIHTARFRHPVEALTP